MMPLKFKQHIEDLFKKSAAFSDSDGNLDVNAILEAIDKIDSELIKILKNDAKAKERFFVQVEDIFVLEQNKLIEFFMQNDYMKNSSYTSYTNKIGLIRKDNFIKKFDDVVLAWPHKDCVLEGGQRKDEEKNKETFYNEILSSDEIERLFEPKVLTNIKRYSYESTSLSHSELDSESTPSVRIETATTIGNIKEDDSLIIKGNNLLALHSLKAKYAKDGGKVKLIYIDPPYNTGNDSFKYNDNFNHSTWLTFMKNRLEVAREFLSNDGVIFVQCDDNEQAYLKVLMDEVFVNKNFISTVINIVKPEGRRYGFLAQAHEYLLVYGKNILSTNMYEMTNYDKKLPYKDSNGNFDIVGLRNRAVKFFNSTNRPNLYYPFYVDTNKIDKDGFMQVSTEYFKDSIEVFPSKVDGLQSVWRWGKDKAKTQADEVIARKSSDGSIKIFKKDYSQTTMPTTFWQNKELITQKGTQQLDKLFNKKVFAFPKPEALIERIIEISTQANDLVMDFHLGSGTTCAVAHKMGRRYIGIEQMDYIEDIALERMKKVIAGEQGGISKSVEWSGGGSFVYAELREIENFKDAEIGKLNKTMKYLPISEIEDAEYGVSQEEIDINKAFYGLENE